MSYRFHLAPKAIAGLKALDSPLQEDTLDELERLAANPSLIGWRRYARAPTFDFIREVGGTRVYVFLTVEYDAAMQTVEVTDLGHFVRRD